MALIKPPGIYMARALKIGEDTYERQLINTLIEVRNAKELSQAALARRMRCVQSKVSRMEASVDEELNLGDVISYIMALGIKTPIAKLIELIREGKYA